MLRSYVGFKVDRGKTKGYVSFKLAMLEYQVGLAGACLPGVH